MASELEFYELLTFDLVYDHEYFIKEHEELCESDKEICESWYKGREYFIENSLKNCEAPNEVFAKDNQLLQSEDGRGKKECLLDKWLKPIDKFRIKTLLTKNYYNKGDLEEKVYKWKLFEENLSHIADFAPNVLEENAINQEVRGSAISKLMLQTLSKTASHKLSNDTLQYLEEGLKNKFEADKCINSQCKLELELLTNQIVNHQKEADEHSDFLLNMISDKEFDYSAKQVVIEGFNNGELIQRSL